MPLKPGAYPILDYDSDPTAMIQPDQVLAVSDDMPQQVVLTFMGDVVAAVCRAAPIIGHLASENGRKPIYRLETDNGVVAVFHAGVGAPLAAGEMEELIALGGRKFIAAGSCGVLVKDIAQGAVIVAQAAVRDEGTSYHYLPPDTAAHASPAAVATIRQVLTANGVPFHVGTTWTNDAIYRETRTVVERRVQQGCVVVEMEAAALMAVAQFRGVVFGQLLYGGDDLAAEAWDSRGYTNDISSRERLFWLAVEAACAL